MGSGTISVNGVDLPLAWTDREADATVILAHGAGGYMDQKTVLWLAGLLDQLGFRVVRFNFPYKALGKSLPDRMPVLMQSYRAVAARVREEFPGSLILAGHSMGGRTASMIAAEGEPADGLLLFGYPLHPAGKPEKLRDEHLPSIAMPTLQLSGTRDELCLAEQMAAILPRLQPTWTLHWLAGADHSYTVRRADGRTKADLEVEIKEAIAAWRPA